MQMFRALDSEAALVGWGVRVLFLAEDGTKATQAAAQRIAGFGGLIEQHAEVFTALEAMIDDPVGYALFIMDCDAFGGLEHGRKAVAMLRGAGGRVPVILVSRDCGEQVFPDDRAAPILLRAPLSAVSLRVGYEHALRDRVIWKAA
jgi:hypothetical protein